MSQSKYGKYHSLQRGRGYGEAKWCVYGRDGTEIVSGQMYDDALDHFNRMEAQMESGKDKKPRMTLDPNIIQMEDDDECRLRLALERERHSKTPDRPLHRGPW